MVDERRLVWSYSLSCSMLGSSLEKAWGGRPRKRIATGRATTSGSRREHNRGKSLGSNASTRSLNAPSDPKTGPSEPQGRELASGRF